MVSSTHHPVTAVTFTLPFPLQCHQTLAPPPLGWQRGFPLPRLQIGKQPPQELKSQSKYSSLRGLRLGFNLFCEAHSVCRRCIRAPQRESEHCTLYAPNVLDTIPYYDHTPSGSRTGFQRPTSDGLRVPGHQVTELCPTHLGHQIPLPPFRISPQRRELQDFLVQKLILGFIPLEAVLLGEKTHQFTPAAGWLFCLIAPAHSPAELAPTPPRRRSHQDHVHTLCKRHLPALTSLTLTSFYF